MAADTLFVGYQAQTVAVPRAKLARVRVDGTRLRFSLEDDTEREVGAFASADHAKRAHDAVLSALAADSPAIDLTSEPPVVTLPNSLEALKLLADWSKWSILVQAGMITAIGTFAKPEMLDKLGAWTQWCLVATVAFFLISILFAARLLKSLPATAQRLPVPKGGDVFTMGTFEGVYRLKVSTTTFFQTYSFIAGLVTFLFAVVGMLKHLS